MKMLIINTAENIHQAAYQGRYEEVKEKVLADNRLLTSTDDSGRQLLHWAACGGHEELASFLIEHGAPVDNTDDCNWSPLMIAASAGREQVVRLLIGRGANVNTQNNGDILHFSTQHPRTIMSADVNLQDTMGATPLHRAASKGNLRSMTPLLQSNMCSIDTTDNQGNTALHLACEEERVDAVRLLLEHGAATNRLNKAGKSPMQMSDSLSIRRLLG